MADPVKALADASRELLVASEMQSDYHALPCREMDAKYGRVIDLTRLAESVSSARHNVLSALAAYDAAQATAASEVDRLRAELLRAQGINSDVESESGYATTFADESEDAPTLPDWVRDQCRELEAMRAENAALRAEVERLFRKLEDGRALIDARGSAADLWNLLDAAAEREETT